MKEDCIFCKIIKGEIPSDKVYEDDDILAFKDIHPAAPVHILIIPKKHIAKLTELTEQDQALVGKMHMVMNQIATDQKVDQDGFRVIINCGKDAGQEVMHLHFHLLAGAKMGPKII